MTDQAKDGGPMFPIPEVRDLDGNGIMAGWNGMSLRDWFAGQALAGMLSDPRCDVSASMFAHRSYLAADAMLAERVKHADATP